VGWRWSFVFLAAIYTTVGVWLLTHIKIVPETLNDGRFRLIGPIAAVLKTPWARIVLLVVLAEGALVFGGLSFVPAYLQQRHGLSSTGAGLITAFFGVGAMLYVIKARWLVGRFGEVKLTFAGGWALAICYATYLLGNNWYWGVVASVLCGFGYYLLHAVLQTNATQMMPAVRGTAVSLFASCLFGGQALGVALGSLLVDHVGIAYVLGLAGAVLPLVGMGFSYALKCRGDESRPLH
jgi:predicted MFS family arabinose efflux permease